MGIATALSTTLIPRALRQCWPWNASGSNTRTSTTAFVPSLTESMKTPSQRPNSSDTPPAAVASPFVALDTPLIEFIMSHLPTEDLILSARAVCREWNLAAEAAALEHFKSAWNLNKVIGMPRTWRSLLNFNPESFVVQRPVVEGDSISALAIAANVTVDQLKRHNNLMTESSLHTRDSVFVPASQFAGRAGEFFFCSVLNRQFVIIERQQHRTRQSRMSQLDPIAREGAEAANRGKLALLLSKGLHVNLNTATFYLHSADGDLRKAMRLYQQDSNWDRLRQR